MRAALAALAAVTLLALAAVAAPLIFMASQPVAAVQELVLQEPDLVYRQGTMAIRLTQQPCGFQGIEKLLEEEGIPPAKGYVMVQEGRPQVRGCWVKAAYDDEVLIQDMAGGDSFIPMSWFKPDPGV